MSEKKTYKPRIADTVLARKLAGKGAVLIEGPKWCGKTTTAEQQAKSVIYMDDPANVKENLLRNSFREILRACLTNGKSRPSSGTPSVSRPITEKETATSSSRALQSLSMKTRKTTRSRKKARRSAIPAPADSAG